jgi:hypothetical protein
LAVAVLCAHPAWQLELLQMAGSVSFPSAHTPHPVLLCRVAKNNPPAPVTPAHPLGVSIATSAALRQT